MKTLITTVSESDDDTDLEFQVDTDSASEGRGGDVGKEEKADIWARIGRRESLEKALESVGGPSQEHHHHHHHHHD